MVNGGDEGVTTPPSALYPSVGKSPTPNEQERNGY